MENGFPGITNVAVLLLIAVLFFLWNHDRAKLDLAINQTAELQSRVDDLNASSPDSWGSSKDYPEDVPEQVIALIEAFAPLDGKYDTERIKKTVTALDDLILKDLISSIAWESEAGQELVKVMVEQKAISRTDIELLDTGEIKDLTAFRKCLWDKDCFVAVKKCLYILRCCILRCRCWPICITCDICKPCLIYPCCFNSCSSCCDCDTTGLESRISALESGMALLNNHNHDSDYAGASHGHTEFTHNHDSDYAGVSHAHAGIYADATHGHPEFTHNHDGDYAGTSHGHAEFTHNHDGDYAGMDANGNLVFGNGNAIIYGNDANNISYSYGGPPRVEAARRST